MSALAPEMEKIPSHGATKWLTTTKAMILLNLRGKAEEQFWFSFFHISPFGSECVEMGKRGMKEHNSGWLMGASNASAGQSSPKSLPDFQRMFPNEEACRVYLTTARFPNGFVCPYCGWTGKP